MADLPLDPDPDIAAMQLKLRGQGNVAPTGSQPLGQGQDEDPDVANMRKGLRSVIPQEAPGKTDATGASMPMASSWGSVNEALNRGMFGWGVPLIAGTEAAMRGVQDVARGVPLSTAFSNATGPYYQSSNRFYQGAENLWQREHPIESGLAAGTGGAVIGAVPIVGLEGVLSRGAGAIADLLPQAWRPTLDWLAGYGGENAASRLASKGMLGSRQALEAEAAQNEPEKDKNYLAAAGLGAVTQGVTHELVSGPYTQGMDTQIDPTVRANALGLQAQGIDVHGGDLARSLPKVSGTQEQLAQTTRAFNARMGLNSDKLTPDIVENHQDNVLSPTFDRLSKTGNGVAMFGPPGAPSVANGLSDIRNEMAQDSRLVSVNVSPGAARPLDSKYPQLMSTITKIENSMDPSTGMIPPDDYIHLTRSSKAGGEIKSLLASPDETLRYYGNKIDNVMKEGLARSTPPEYQQELAQVRQQWNVSKAAQALAPAAERDNGGYLNPMKIQGQLRAHPDAGLQDISAGARLLPRSDQYGDVIPPKKTGIANKLWSGLAHGGLGTALLGGGLLEYALPEVERMAGNWPWATGLGAGVAALRGLSNLAARKLVNSPEYTNLLLGNDTPRAAALGNLLRFGEQAPTQATNALLHSQPPKDEPQEP